METSHSDVVLVRREDGITLTATAKGLIGGSFHLFPLGIVMLVLDILVFSIVVSQLAQSGNFKDLPMICLFALMFGSISVFITLCGFHLGKLQTIVAVSYGSLFISRQSPLAKTTRQWDQSQIESIEVGKSGIEINDKPLMQFEVVSRDGSKYGCLRQLSEHDLNRAVYEVRKALAASSAEET